MRTLFNILCTCSVISSSAQSWCPPGATWKYDTGSPWGVSQTMFEYAADTTVDGHIAQRIDQLSQQTVVMGIDTFLENSGPVTITRTNGAVVWEWDGVAQTWDTLYWFTAVPGDEWQPRWAFGAACPDQVLRVLDTATVMVSGLPLRSLTVQRFELGVPVGSQLPVIERIGGAAGYFEWMPECGTVFECFCYFLCYEDQDISYPDTTATCDLTLGIGDTDKDRSNWFVWPIPGSERLNIGSNDMESHAVASIRNSQGQLLIDRTPIAGALELNTASWASGAYIIEVVGSKGVRLHLRWLKQ